jgi:arabinosyltransferase A
LVGVVLCGLVPLLPVKQTTATILWPQAPAEDGFVGDLTAPLVSGAPKSLDVTIPCRVIATLPADGGLVFSTNPPGGIDASRNGLFVRAGADDVYVAFRDTVAAVAPRDAIRAGACSELRVWANVGAVGADFVGIPNATGTLTPDKRPQVSGVFTDLKVAPQEGLAARIDVDTRFITSPTALKLLVMVLGVVCVLASIVALALLDRRVGRTVPRSFLRRWRAPLWTSGTSSAPSRPTTDTT